MNPFVNLYRKVIPKCRTKNEKPFTKQELSIIKILFSNADFSYFECTTLFTKIFFIKTFFFITKTKKILIRIDEKILKVKNNKK